MTPDMVKQRDLCQKYLLSVILVVIGDNEKENLKLMNSKHINLYNSATLS